MRHSEPCGTATCEHYQFTPCTVSAAEHIAKSSMGMNLSSFILVKWTDYFKPRPSTHRIFGVADVMFLVCQALHADDGDYRSTLRNLACLKAFHEPAIKILWRHLPGLGPLLDVLSSPNIEQNIDEVRRRWQYATKYMNSVRSLDLGTRTDKEHSNVKEFLRLAAIVSADNPFLFLGTLNWTMDLESEDFFYDVLSLLSRRSQYLRDICIMVLSRSLIPMHLSDHFLQELYAHVPKSLRRLSVHSDGRMRQDASVATLQQLRQLAVDFKCCPCRRLEQPEIEPSFVEALATLPHLVELDLRNAQLRATEITPVTLPHLQRLLLSGHPLHLKPLMRAISVPRLQSLSLYLVRPQDQQRHYTHEVLEEVHAQYSTNIRSLEIDYEEVQYFDGQSEASEVLMSMIRPLLSMSHLEDVNIKLHGRSLSFRSTDLLLLAQRWPHIASLTIRFDPVGKSESPALKDVVEFSRMCPTLHTLILSHVTPDPPCTTEGGISISCTLPCLVVIDFESLTDTLQTLVNSFPKLDTEKCIQKANSLPVRGSWLDVLDSLSRLRENP